MCPYHSQYHKKAQAKQTNVIDEGLARSGWGGLADVAIQSRACDYDRTHDIRVKKDRKEATQKSLLDTVAEVKQELGELKEAIHYMQGVQDVQNQTIERLLSVHTLDAEVADLEEEHKDVISFPVDES